METAATATATGLIDAISESVKLIGNFNSLSSVLQDEMLAQSGGSGIIGGMGSQICLEGMAGENGVPPLLPESSDLIYTDLSYNVTINTNSNSSNSNCNNKVEDNHNQNGRGNKGCENGGVVTLWGMGGEGEGTGSALSSDLDHCSNIFGSLLGPSPLSSASVVTVGNVAGVFQSIHDLDRVSLSDNFSFLGGCSDMEKTPVKLKSGAGEVQYAKGLQTIKSEQFEVPSTSTMTELVPPSATDTPVSLYNLLENEMDSFSTINAKDLDELLEPPAPTSTTSPPLKCGSCSKTFTNPMTMQIHMRLHTGERPYKCKVCREAFIHYTYLELHMKTVHGENNQSQSNNTIRIVDNGSSNHQTEIKVEPAVISTPTSTTSTSPKSGSPKKKSNGKNGVTKPDPNATGGPFTCPYCQKGFRHSSWLIMHLRTHTGEKPFKCSHCDLAFTQRGNLMQHLKKLNHYSGNETPTSIPDANINNFTSSTSTTTTVTTAVTSATSNLTLRRIQKKKKKVAIPDSSQVNGKEQRNKEDINLNKKGKRPVKCTICGEGFTERHALITHMRSHGGKSFGCPECGRKFRQQANMQKHIRDMHGTSIKNSKVEKSSTDKNSQLALTVSVDVKPIYQNFDLRPCQVPLERCDSSVPELKPAVKKKKTGLKSRKKKISISTEEIDSQEDRQAAFASGSGHKCPICGKILLTTTNLTVHMRIHTGEKPYQCSFCTKRFSVQSNLKAHVRLHTGEKPYQCSLCSTGFATRGNFTAHLRSHGVNPYKCSLCPEQFTFSWKLKKHMLVAHNKKMKAEHKTLLQ